MFVYKYIYIICNYIYVYIKPPIGVCQFLHKWKTTHKRVDTDLELH